MNTGQQWDYEFLYYLVGFGGLAVMIAHFIKEMRHSKKIKKEIESKQEKQAHEKNYTMSMVKTVVPDSSWTSEDIGVWIENSEALKEVSSLTQGELGGISDKFVKAGVNGVVFPLVAYDTTALKQDVGLTVGEAVLFAHTMEKMRSPGYTEEPTTSDLENKCNELASGVQATSH